MKDGKYPIKPAKGLVLEDRDVSSLDAADNMVRTQVYLTRQEHEFLQNEALRRGEPMSAFLRRVIDDRMKVPDDAWTNNPMLEPTPKDVGWEGHEDGALNHDHYVYGGPKKYAKVRGEWTLLPPEK